MLASRCNAMEKVADNMLFPCKFSTSGCKSMLKCTEKVSHENEKCDFRPLNCPFRFRDRCVDFLGDRNELLSHLVDNHHTPIKKFTAQNLPLSCYALLEKSNKVDLVKNKASLKSMSTFIVGFDNHDFVVNHYYFHNNVNYVHFMTVQLMGSIAEAENYTYSIILIGLDQELTFAGKCFSLHKEVNTIYENRECLHFDASTALKFQHPYKHGEAIDKIFKFDIKLFKKEEPPKSTVKSPTKHTARKSTGGKVIKKKRVTRATTSSPLFTRSRTTRKQNC